MAKQLRPVALDPAACRGQIDEFAALLAANPELSERTDVLPFFRARPQLAALVGILVPHLGPATEYAFEYPLFGDFVADLIVGRRDGRRFCLVEFEDGRVDSIFATRRGKATTEWGRRFEHGFSQLVDWFRQIDDLKKTDRFRQDFGPGHVHFAALLVIGRDAGVSDADRPRLDWRTEKVRIDSHAIECLTFDGLHEHMDRHLRLNTGF